MTISTIGSFETKAGPFGIIFGERQADPTPATSALQKRLRIVEEIKKDDSRPLPDKREPDDDDDDDDGADVPDLFAISRIDLLHNATVLWATAEGYRAVPGPPYDHAWCISYRHGIVLARRGTTFYRLMPEQPPRLIADLGRLLELPDLRGAPWQVTVAPHVLQAGRQLPDGTLEVHVFWDGVELPTSPWSEVLPYRVFPATDAQPARLVTPLACYVREATGAVRLVGTVARPGEIYRACYLAPNREHIVVELDDLLDEELRVPRSRLDTYTTKGKLVSRTVFLGDSDVGPDLVEMQVVHLGKNTHWTTDFLLPHLDDPANPALQVITRLSDKNSPSLRVLVRRDGDLFVADASGKRLHDLPDDVQRIVMPNRENGTIGGKAAVDFPTVSCWAAETPRELWLLNTDGRCLARIPPLKQKPRRVSTAGDIDISDGYWLSNWAVGTLVVEKVVEIDDRVLVEGFRVFDDQKRDLTGRVWRHVVLLNEDILALIADDELRYLRASDRSTIWSWKGSFRPTVNSQGNYDVADGIYGSGSGNN